MLFWGEESQGAGGLFRQMLFQTNSSGARTGRSRPQEVVTAEGGALLFILTVPHSDNANHPLDQAFQGPDQRCGETRNKKHVSPCFHMVSHGLTLVSVVCLKYRTPYFK